MNKAFKQKIVDKFSSIIDVVSIILLAGVMLVGVLEIIQLIQFFIGNNVSGAIGSILYIIIIIELFVILTDFVLERHISITRVIEIGIISLVRDIIFKFEKLQADTMLSIGIVLVALAIMFWVTRHYQEHKIKLSSKKQKK